MKYVLLKFRHENRVSVFAIYLCFTYLDVEVFLLNLVKSWSTISAFLAKHEHNLQNQHSWWHNFRNIGALLVAYYATFANTIYQSLLSVEMFYVSLLTITIKSQKKKKIWAKGQCYLPHPKTL